MHGGGNRDLGPNAKLLTSEADTGSVVVAALARPRISQKQKAKEPNTPQTIEWRLTRLTQKKS